MPPVPPVIDEHPGNARDEEAIGVSSGSEEEVGPEGERQDSLHDGVKKKLPSSIGIFHDTRKVTKPGV